MNEKIKKTALETSAGTDEKQSLINSNNIITDEDDFCNSDDLFAEFREESNPNFIRTFTLGELFDKSYDIKQPIIKDFFIRECTYLSVHLKSANRLQCCK